MVIGADPLKRPHTAVVLEEDEEIAAALQVAADRQQVERVLAWANGWPANRSLAPEAFSAIVLGFVTSVD